MITEAAMKKVSSFVCLKENNQGAILVFLAIFAGVLVMLIGLAIDSARLGAAQQKQSRVAEYAALGALQEYLGQAGNYTAKVNAARTRAEEIAGFTLNELWAQTGERQAVTGDFQDAVSGAGSDNRGTITPGDWFFTEPQEGCDNVLAADIREYCPCVSSAWVEPCFRPNTTTSVAATAFRILMHTKSGNPISNVFTRVNPAFTTGFDINSSATATLVPRHAAFIVDLSSSIAGENFNQLYSSNAILANTPAEEAGTIAFPAFGLNSNSTTVDETSMQQYFYSYTFFGTTEWPEATYGITYGGLVSAQEDSSTPAGTRPAGTQCALADNSPPPDKHFKSDYQHTNGNWSIQGVNIDDTGGADEYYLVESADKLTCNGQIGRDVCKTQDASGNCTATMKYYGAEPLTSIVWAIHNAAVKMRDELTVASDQMLILGFDGAVPVVPDPADIANGTAGLVGWRRIGPIDVRNTSFTSEVVDFTDRTNVTAYGNRLQRGFFPRTPPWGGGLGGFTDLPGAIIAARQALAAGGKTQYSNSWIALFSDGILSCKHDGVDSDGNPLPFISVVDDVYTLAPAVCDNTQDVHTRAALELEALISGTGALASDLPTGYTPFANADIAVHTFLFGDYVQPHTKLFKKGNHCSSDGEARADNLGYTQGSPSTCLTNADAAGCYNNNSAANPFLEPNKMFYKQFAVPTQGRFFPIRKACDPAVAFPAVSDPVELKNKCKAGDLVKLLDNACGALTDDGDPLDDDDEANDIGNVDSFVDHGRLICDPYCREPSEQMNSAMEDLFKDNPFILVERKP